MMGLFSKDAEVHQKGDQQVSVSTTLDAHTSYHESHNLKLWFIIAGILCIALGFLYRAVKQNLRKHAIRAARSTTVLDA